MFYILVAKLRHIYQHGREQPPTRRKQAAIAVVDPKCSCLMSLGRNVWFRRVSGRSPCFLPGFRKGSQARTISSCTSTLFCRHVAALPRLLDFALMVLGWRYPLPSSFCTTTLYYLQREGFDTGFCRFSGASERSSARVRFRGAPDSPDAEGGRVSGAVQARTPASYMGTADADLPKY